MTTIIVTNINVMTTPGILTLTLPVHAVHGPGFNCTAKAAHFCLYVVFFLLFHVLCCHNYCNKYQSRRFNQQVLLVWVQFVLIVKYV